jgi:oligopeptide/dipeptide ABC transporter ATP-binding protein
VLLSAIPIPDPEQNRNRTRTKVAGEVPNPINPPSGCRFHPRCPRATSICRTAEPPLTEYIGGHLAACHHPQNVSSDEIAESIRSELSPLSAGSDVPEAAQASQSGPSTTA